MLRWVHSSRYDGFKSQVKVMGFPYEVHSTGSSEYIKNAHYGFITSTHYLGAAILGHLVSCKCEILHNAKEKSLLIPDSVKWYKISDYFMADEPPRRMFVSEFDLNHAYWSVAYRLGFIGQKTYDKFLRFKTKHFRLIALGMLAKREYVAKFDEKGNRVGSVDVKVNEIGVQIFRRIAWEVAEEMQRLSEARPDAFRFYWFDNIIFDRFTRHLETDYAYKQKDETLQLLFVPKRKVILKLGEREFMFPSVQMETMTNVVPF